MVCAGHLALVVRWYVLVILPWWLDGMCWRSALVVRWFVLAVCLRMWLDGLCWPDSLGG